MNLYNKITNVLFVLIAVLNVIAMFTVLFTGQIQATLYSQVVDHLLIATLSLCFVAYRIKLSTYEAERVGREYGHGE